MNSIFLVKQETKPEENTVVYIGSVTLAPAPPDNNITKSNGTKYLIGLLLVVVLLVALDATNPPSHIAPAVGEVSVVINGQRQTFGISPVIINGRAMLPLRTISESLGMEVDYNSATNTVQLTAEGISATHGIGTSEIITNGVPSQFDTASIVVDSWTLVPARMIAEAASAEVDWDADSRTVTLTTYMSEYDIVGNPRNH